MLDAVLTIIISTSYSTRFLCSETSLLFYSAGIHQIQLKTALKVQVLAKYKLYHKPVNAVPISTYCKTI